MRIVAFISIIAGAAFLSGCVTQKEEEPIIPILGGNDNLSSAMAPPKTYSQFVKSTSSNTGINSVNADRFSALREAALSYSAQAGYARRTYEIFQELQSKSGELSSEYNFNDVVFKAPKEVGYIVPPVVARAKAALTIKNGGRESVAADEYYRIEEPGRLVGVIPTWRDYLVMNIDKPEDPSDQFLPSDSDERKIWNRYMGEGWAQGKQQAEQAFKANMALLRRDYLGMIEYRRLVDAGLIKNMVLASSEVRARGTSDELFIGQRRVKIVDAAVFQTNPKHWKPVKQRFAAYK